MIKINFRSINLFIILSIAVLLLFSLYLQFIQNLQPCPLCSLQRIIFVALMLISILAFIHNPMNKWTKRLYISTSMILSVIGSSLAARQLWLQSLPPDQAPACGPSLGVMLKYMPTLDALQNAIIGSGDCAKVDWNLFNISIAGYSFIGFLFYFILCCYLFTTAVADTTQSKIIFK